MLEIGYVIGVEMDATTQQRPLSVMIDTNIWRASLLLRSSLGVALIYAVRQHNGTIGLPEVVEREIETSCLAAGRDASLAAQKAARQLERLLGKETRFYVPTEQQLTEGIRKRLQQIEQLFQRIPLTVEHARSALDRVNARAAPNEKRQEYKDSLIWEAVLELAQTSKVYLVSEDSGFFRGESLNPSLAEECRRRELQVQGFRSLEACLITLAPTPPDIYSNATIASIRDFINSWSDDQLTKALPSFLERRDFNATTVIRNTDIQLFATEDPLNASLAFTVRGDLLIEDSSTEGREHGTFELQSSGTFDTGNGSVIDLSGPTIDFVWETATEGQNLHRFVYASGEKFVTTGPSFEALRDNTWRTAREF